MGDARDNAVAKSQNAVGESAGRQAAANSVKSTAGEARKAEDSPRRTDERSFEPLYRDRKPGA